MNKQFQKAEEDRLRSLEREYKQKDYRVLIHPSRDNLPSFLSNFEPDMVAYGPKENVVIEVETQSTLSRSPQLKPIAEAVKVQAGWRFELVVINPEKERVADEEAQSLDGGQINNRLNIARTLLDQQQYEAAFLLAWSAMEAILRERARASSISIETRSLTSRLIKEFYTIGSLSRSDYEALDRMLKLRSLVVHGFRAVNLSGHEVMKLLSISENMQKEK